MNRLLALFLIFGAALGAQSRAKADLLRLTSELEAAVARGDWREASQLSQTLKANVKSTRDESLASGTTELVDSILTWLPADTETLVVAQQAFTITTPDRTQPPTGLAMAQGYVMMLLVGAERQALYKSLEGRTVRLATLAARRFGEYASADHEAAPSLGMIPYQGCAAYSFTEPVAESSFGRPPDERILGQAVWASQNARSKDSYFVSLVKPDLIVACNHREFFREMITRMATPLEPRALPASLLEWKQLDRRAPLWGISHYRGTAGFFNSQIPGRMAEGATGITVEFGLPSDGSRARLLAKANPWRDLVKSRDWSNTAHAKPEASGVWELVVDGKPEAAFFAAFALMAALGFVVMV